MPRRLAEPVALGALAERIGGELDAAARSRPIVALATLASAGPQDLAFLSSAGYRAEAAATRAGAVLVSPALADAPAPSAARVLVADPYLAFARIAQWFDAATRRDDGGPERHPSAVVDPRARIGRGVRIGAHAVIEADAEIGDEADVGAQSFVGAGARVGAGTRLHAHVTVHADCVIGARGIVHSGTVIGADGFGFARDGAAWVKIPQLGRVVIGDDVEIGANCAIDRGALDDTVIGDGCKLDNLIQVAHNVRIGEHTAIAGCVGIAGSAVIGRRCMLGGGVGVPGHVEICDDVVIAGMTLVPGSITRPGYYAGGPPMMEHAQWQKASAVVRQLPELRQRLRALERRLPDPTEGST